jgi:hypothetical protein
VFATLSKLSIGKICGMAKKITPDGSLYGLEVGTRWSDTGGRRTVIVLWVQRSGVVVYRDEGAAPDDERVINILRFVETFVPANSVGEGSRSQA